MLKSGLGPAAVLLLAVACVLLRPTAPPVSHQGSAAGGGGQQAVGGTCGGKRTQPQAGCYSRPRPTPNSTTAAPAAATGVAATPGSGPPQGALLSQPAGDGLYIVRFRQYRMAADHLAALQAALAYGSPPDSWQWVERHNPAAAFPTDFGLLRLAAPEAALKSRLEQLPFVKGVHPERRLTRSLLAAPEPGAEQQEEHAQDAAAADAARPGTQFAPCSSSSSGGVGSLEQACASKRQGRLQTRPTFSLEDNLSEEEEELADALSARIGNDTFTPESSQQRRLRRRLQGRRRRQLLQQGTLASILQADSLWAQGFRGQGVKMGVFDTGIKGDHPDVKHIVERSNWTHEPTLDDGLGHGSFVAGVIAGTEPTCPGLAPEVSLYTFRVFTNDQVSYTSWFLDAFNYAIASRMNVVNLSIGGPDYLDEPFAEKVAEITSAGIIMVSAIGNDGPLYGTLNNPADQNDVIGIGGIDYSDQIAPFSSRGMSTWEVPLGYGRSKPDVMAYGRDVQGSKIGGGCRSLSGTSVASPVVAGAVCLLASVVPEEKRWQLLNPASMKQALVEGAVRLPGLNLYEQGAGKLSVVNSKAVLEQYVPRASLVPASLNFTDCPYMWPFCRQPLYATAMPLMFNATILNGLGLTGRLEGAPAWTPADDGGRLLDVRFEYSEQLWPWSGYLALFIRVRDEGAAFQGSGGGEVAFTVVSPPAPGEAAPRRSTVRVPLTVGIIPTPDRKLRLLWDQFHSIRYPPAYFPRDDLQVRHDILDWHGDHPHTNYHDMFNALRDEGFFLEVLASPATCFNASLYGSLLVVDSEDEWYPEEVAKLAADVEGQGLGLLVFADWYHLESIQRLRFYDDNTRSWWEAATGGANVPALNDMLTPYGVAFESGALEVEVHIKGVQGPFHMASGVPLKTLPVGSWMHRADPKPGDAQSPAPGFPVLGLLQHGAGRVGLYGDSNCLDSSHSRSKCFKLLIKMAAWAAGEAVPALTPPEALLHDHFGDFDVLPQRRSDFNFTEASPVLQNALRCYPNAPLAYQGSSFERWKVPVSRPVRQPVAVQPDTTAATQSVQQQQEQAVLSGGGANGTGVQQPQPAAGGSGQATSQQQQQQQQPQQQTGSEQSTQTAVSQQTATGQEQQQQQQPAVKQQEQVPLDQRVQEQQAAEALKQKASEQELAEIKKQEEALLKRKEEMAKGQAGGRQQQEPAGGGGGAAGGGDATGDASGDERDHPDIGGLAQFGEGQPQHVEKVEQVLEPAHTDGERGGQAGSGGGNEGGGKSDAGAATGTDAEARGEGGPARITSLMHKQDADEAAAALEAADMGRGGRSGSFLHVSLVQACLLLAVAGGAAWSRSRRRRGPPLRLASRKWLLPLTLAGTGAGVERDRHE